MPDTILSKGIWSIGVGLIMLGAYLLLKPWFDRRKLFGKAEER